MFLAFFSVVIHTAKPTLYEHVIWPHTSIFYIEYTLLYILDVTGGKDNLWGGDSRPKIRNKGI